MLHWWSFRGLEGTCIIIYKHILCQWTLDCFSTTSRVLAMDVLLVAGNFFSFPFFFFLSFLAKKLSRSAMPFLYDHVTNKCRVAHVLRSKVFVSKCCCDVLGKSIIYSGISTMKFAVLLAGLSPPSSAGKAISPRCPPVVVPDACSPRAWPLKVSPIRKS